MEIKQRIENHLEKLSSKLDQQILDRGEMLYQNGRCQILSQSPINIDLLVYGEDENDSSGYSIHLERDSDHVFPKKEGKEIDWDAHAIACMLQIQHELHLLDPKISYDHKKYTRSGMIKRVVSERRQKARSAEYKIKWADNIYGDHVLINERGVKYTVFLRDFENETGYSDSLDAKLNKLGTTKHIMYAFDQLKENKSLYKKLKKTFPFIEIYCDPLNEYKITYFYPYTIPAREKLLLSRYFKSKKHLEEHEIHAFLGFIREAENNPMIKIRNEVYEKLDKVFEKEILKSLEKEYRPDFSAIRATLFEYQKEGVLFSLFKKASIIADEMGLGKTLQAITTAILKKSVFDFNKTLIVCPASLKAQWKKEIEKFSDEKALIIQGFPDERAKQYESDQYYFFIVNYETILRDHRAINQAGFDFLILDEVQRAKNFETKTSLSLKRLEVKHYLAITGTPIENKLIDIFSIMSILDPYFFGPLWEFSYQHCLFDPSKPNKINGYYNLKSLNKRLGEIIIRREKRKVIDQLPSVQQIDIPVSLSPIQAEYHAKNARGIAKIISKKFLTPYDHQRILLLLTGMRMVCDSSFLVDDSTHESPKLNELEYMLVDKLDIANHKHKIIIFSEWIKVHKLIGSMLRKNNIGFVELNGKMPVKSRGELIRKFEENPQYKVFLSTEAGGAGLNLQVANMLINFELPWNPAKKNQRIGRIDRIGQKSNKLTIYNFITKNSIEEKIAEGLVIKQNLFDNVLSAHSLMDFVDFSTKGRSQFIRQLEEMIAEPANAEWMEAEINEEPVESPNGMDAAGKKTDLDFSGDDLDELKEADPVSRDGKDNKPVQENEMAQIMQHGMQFLAGMYKMSTGKDLNLGEQSISVDEETGEITMKFRIPK